MRIVLVLGAGNIGSLIACWLANTGEYHVYLASHHTVDMPVTQQLSSLKLIKLDVDDVSQMNKFLAEHRLDIIISCLPYFYNVRIAEYAKQHHLHYFDLTEDVESAEKVALLANDAEQVFMPRCGLAPGFINILTHDLIQGFTQVESVELRVGNIPINVNNALHYVLSWSTDGLINEYGNVCYGIVDGKKVAFEPLEDLEMVEIDGLTYEAFNTSGGIGSLANTYAGRIKSMNYKTLRYPGHCEKMRFLMKDLRLNEDRATLKRILENVLPRTSQDVALIYVAITGIKGKHRINETYVNKIYPHRFLDKEWAAIQVTTAAGLCAAMEVVLADPNHYRGLVLQEQIKLSDFLQNRFGKVFVRQELSSL